MNLFVKNGLGSEKLMVAFCLLVCLSHLCEALTCDHLKYQYYHKQAKRCMDCDVCVIGEGKIKFENGMDLKFGPHGATICLPCRTCPKGTFSDRRSHGCDPCTNCTVKNLLEERPCIHLNDAICGGKIIPRVNIEVPYTTRKHERRKRYVKGSSKKSMGFWIGIVATIIIVLLGALFLIYLHINRKGRQQNVTPRSEHECIPLNEDPATNESDEYTEQDVEDIGQSLQSRSSSLTTISEEHLVNRSSDALQYTREKDISKVQTSKETQKCKNIWYRVKNAERAPLLPKRKRYSSCTVDYGTSNKSNGYDNPILSQRHQDGATPHLQHTSLTRRKSFPLSCPESNLLERDKSYEMDSVPSQKFCSYFSKLAVANNIFIVIAKDNGLEEEKLNQLHRTFINIGIREVAYRVAMELSRMKVTKEKIYESLERHQYIDVLINLQMYDLKTNLNKHF